MMSFSLTTLATLALALTGLTTTPAATSNSVASASNPSAAPMASAALMATAAQVVVSGQTGGRSELDAVRGQYDLAADRLLSVAPRGPRLVADLSGPRRDAAVALQLDVVPMTLHV